MASKPPPSKADAPLSFMQHLSPSVSYFTPSDGAAKTSSSSDPELVLILSWMDARDVHIAKYVAQHRTMFPSSRILLVRSPVTHVFWPPLARKRIAPAIPILKALAEPEPSDKKKPKVLMHIFSNGGVNAAARIREMLKDVSLPRYVLCMDSCPGYFHYSSAYKAISQSLPWWASPFLHMFLMTVCALIKLRLTRPTADRDAEGILVKALVATEVRRTYLYSTGDKLIDWHDVEDHAARAASTGFRVRMEKFEGAGHVSLARAEGERYWRVIRETWDRDD